MHLRVRECNIMPGTRTGSSDRQPRCPITNGGSRCVPEFEGSSCRRKLRCQRACRPRDAGGCGRQPRRPENGPRTCYARGGSCSRNGVSTVLAVRCTVLRVWPGFSVRWFSFFAVCLLSVSFGLQWPFVILHLSFYGSKNNFRSRVILSQRVSRACPVKGSKCENRTIHRVYVNNGASRRDQAGHE